VLEQKVYIGILEEASASGKIYFKILHLHSIYIDKKCPLTGNVSIRGQILSDVVTKMNAKCILFRGLPLQGQHSVLIPSKTA
uniref:Small ribosomal subunit protein uS17 N-terminal domain-containing protein n=1 Tax=Coturnix japonica TaxID=93934 RepID=A0A8C2UBJ4_COTJA